MRSSGSMRWRAAVATLLCALAFGGDRPRAQSAQAKSLYTQALEREASLRKELDEPAAKLSAETLVRIRTLVGTYEDLARLFPTGGYSDNALWQGAMLSADAFRRFGDATDRGAALQLLEALTTKFAGSTLAKKAPGEVKRLAEAGVASVQLPSPAAVPPPAARPAPMPPATASASAPVTLTAIRRESLPDALRITLELEREVPFHDEQIGGPPRVFLDLQNTRAVAGLRDAVDAYDQRRHGVAPYRTQRDVDRFGTAGFYGWSEDKARQYAEPQRTDWGAFVKRKGFKLE